MWLQPEMLHLDILCPTFDINSSGVIECYDDIEFVTQNLTDVCLQHYGNKNKVDQITSSTSKISDVFQLKVEGHVVIYFFTILQ